ncbi:hypothetical protein ACTXKI_12355 [Psychrobacter celer]|uniref:hypothetical protein n=1 Tax=Psychrobacter celer TaxID=306572 RepID=UPI003FD2F48E
MTKTHLRILGGIIILFNLVIIGENNIEGIMVLVLTLGVAVFFELVLVKNFASDRTKTPQK